MSDRKRGPRSDAAERDLVENQQRAVRVELRALRTFLTRLKRELRLKSRLVGVRFIDDREMTRLNETYRNKKGSTDVLSFTFDAGDGWKKRSTKPGRYLGDIAISPRVARRNAKTDQRRLDDELRILILHGVLHLLGYDHETDSGEMDRVEQKLRRRLRLA